VSRYNSAVLAALPLAAAEWEARRDVERRAAEAPAAPPEPLPQDVAELAEAAYRLTGIRVPDRAVCPGHAAPLTALAAAFFARSPMTVWHASRGFGGKTTLMALLGHLETVLLGADVTILGGSGQQSQRVHEAQSAFWRYHAAPVGLLDGEPTRYETRLTNGGRTTALMASSRSVRGGHPQRLRLDEADEIKLEILDASLGQTMMQGGIAAQTVMSSTHQYADGTMTEILKRSAERGWPVYRWCWRESLQPHGWLDPAEVERKRGEVPAAMFLAEYDLQEPSPESRAIQPEMVDAMFKAELGTFGGRPGEAIEIEPPQQGATYATGADWAKDRDWTVVTTFRTDVRPMRLVAYQRDGRRPWPHMVSILDARSSRFPGPATHDGTGLGDVVDDLLTTEATGLKLVGRARSDLLSDYVKAIENGELEAPRIEHPYGEHKYATLQDLYGSGHLPDSICAGALALYAYRHPPLKRAAYVY
jgi:hypothetical protein